MNRELELLAIIAQQNQLMLRILNGSMLGNNQEIIKCIEEFEAAIYKNALFGEYKREEKLIPS